MYTKYGQTDVSTSSASSSLSTNSTLDPQMDLFYSLRQESVKRVRSDQSATNEYGRYIETDWIQNMTLVKFNNFDILAWWKGMKNQFSVLPAMAQDLLAVQASTVYYRYEEQDSHGLLWRCVFA